MSKDNKDNRLIKKKVILPAPPSAVQIPLFQVEKQVERDGVEMGVLKDGTPFLSESGLARMCGISRSSFRKRGFFIPKP